MNRMFSCALLCALIFAGCKKEDVKPVEINKNKIAELTSDKTTITLWSEKAGLTTGYNKLYVSLKEDNGKEISNAAVSFMPMMDMGTMKHSSPLEQPLFNSTLRLYEGAVVFTMPTSAMGSWQLDVSVNSVTVSFPVTINSTTQKHVASFVGTDENKYFISLVSPLQWKIGLNDLDIVINRQASKMDFPADDGFTVAFFPEMPSMEHGSPNNVDPVLKGNGHYLGKVNYTMSGDWRLHFKLKKNGIVIKDDVSLDILF